MATEWFYQQNGEIVGPLTAAELLAGIRKGRIQPDSLLRKDDSQWVAAAEVNGLFEAADRDLVRYYCPYCRARVHKPPTRCVECQRDINAVYQEREQIADMPEDVQAEKSTRKRDLLGWLKSLFSSK
jgi:hypothetical protein